MTTWISVLGLGAAGVALRFLLERIPPAIFGFPIMTGLINLMGSFLAGLAFTHFQRYPSIPEGLRMGVSVGFLGGFTTFSAFTLQAARLCSEGRWTVALLYSFGSVLLGILMVFLGMWVARPT